MTGIWVIVGFVVVLSLWAAGGGRSMNYYQSEVRIASLGQSQRERRKLARARRLLPPSCGVRGKEPPRHT